MRGTRLARQCAVFDEVYRKEGSSVIRLMRLVYFPVVTDLTLLDMIICFFSQLALVQ